MHDLVVDLIKFNVIHPTLFLALAPNERLFGACHKALKQSAHQRGTFSSFSAVYIFSVKGVSNVSARSLKRGNMPEDVQLGKIVCPTRIVGVSLVNMPSVKSRRNFNSLPGSVTSVTCDNSLPTMWISFFSIQLIDKTYLSHVQFPTLLDLERRIHGFSGQCRLLLFTATRWLWGEYIAVHECRDGAGKCKGGELRTSCNH